MIDTRIKKVFVGISAATLLALTAMPAAAQDEPPLLYAINKEADQQYFIDLQTSFVAKAEELGATALAANAELDPSLGVSLVNDAISAGAKGIAITVPDQTIGPAVAMPRPRQVSPSSRPTTTSSTRPATPSPSSASTAPTWATRSAPRPRDC